MAMAKRYGRILIIVLCILGISGSTRLSAQEITLPEPVSNALARFADLKTFSVSWNQHRQAGELTRKKLNLKPVDPQKFGHPQMCYLVWQNGKMYSRRIDGGREWKDAPKQRRLEF